MYRGLCTTGNVCWDACNDQLHPDERAYSTDENTQDAIALMIKELRTGIRNPFGQGCPGGVLKSTCNAGERCTPPGLTLYRGMCVTSATAGVGNQCLDMCDTKIPLETFKASVGKQAGTYSMAEQVRAGRDPQGYTECPGLSPWLWLWIPILLLILIGCCGAAYYMYNKMRRMKRGKGQDQQEQPLYQDQYQYPAEYPEDGGMQPPMEPMTVTEDPMPALAPETAPYYEPEVPQAPVAYSEVAVAPFQPVEVQPSSALFGQPNLMGGFPTTTVAAPVTTMLPTQYSSAPITMQGAYPAYPQASSMAMSNTMMSQYGAAPFGAYGQQVGSTSYRVG